MTKLTLTKTKIRQGIWQGIVTGADNEAPQIEVSHLDNPVADVKFEHNKEAGQWLMSFPIPPSAIADGVHTILIRDIVTGATLGNATLIAGEVLEDDIRAELDLLRAELDMVKSAFRRHCLETK